MTDNEIVDAIFEKCERELHPAFAPKQMRAEIVKALESKQRQIDRLQADMNTMSGIMREYSQELFDVCERQPVAYEVPGFHLAGGGGVAAWTAVYAKWSDIKPDDFRIFDVRRVLCEEATNGQG